MAATVNTKSIEIVQDIQLKRNNVPGVKPLATELTDGEIGINSADGKAFLKKDDGTIVEIGSNPDLTPYVKSVPAHGSHEVKVVNMVGMTQVEYDALKTKDDHTLYIII